MSPSDPGILPALDRLAAEAEAYVTQLSDGVIPYDPARTRDAWHTIYAREILLGNALPVVISWLHPAGWACIDLVGGPGPISTVITLPLSHAGFRAYLERLCAQHIPIYVQADFFHLPPWERCRLFLTIVRDHRADHEPARQEPTS
ncbi:MAG: hypothetical protein M3456_15020 [Actinomycetota bacterium]|nr:hypothetical protein [Actinomycetota bacterium]